MTSLEKSDIVTTNVRYRMPNVHPDGRKFVVVAAAITALFAFLAWETLAWPMALVTLWVASFFRDPIRTTPKGEGLIIAPADGMVTSIIEVIPPREMQGEDGLGAEPVTRVSIFMSVFDVHINRSPIAGEIKRVVYIPASSSTPISTRPARRMSAIISWSKARMASGSASPRSPGWSRGGSCRGSSRAIMSPPASGSG